MLKIYCCHINQLETKISFKNLKFAHKYIQLKRHKIQASKLTSILLSGYWYSGEKQKKSVITVF